ncbi:MAG: hypothetical protein ACREGR_04235 [Minisyncoccia bacterium]
MKMRDFDRERSELRVPQAEFIARYNEGLPATFPKASAALLKEYRTKYPGQFKPDGLWSLEIHRKKVMDWLPAHLKSLEPAD